VGKDPEEPLSELLGLKLSAKGRVAMLMAGPVAVLVLVVAGGFGADDGLPALFWHQCGFPFDRYSEGKGLVALHLAKLI
jgi:hypothetical protein